LAINEQINGQCLTEAPGGTVSDSFGVIPSPGSHLEDGLTLQFDLHNCLSGSHFGVAKSGLVGFFSGNSWAGLDLHPGQNVVRQKHTLTAEPL
jgi:hypothetical protein